MTRHGRWTGLLFALLVSAHTLAADLPAPNGEWQRYTVATIREAVPPVAGGNDVEVLPLQRLYTFPTVNYFELRTGMTDRGRDTSPEAIVVANGTYDLARIAELVDDTGVIERVDEDTFIGRLPIYVAPTASLVLDGIELRLSVRHVAALFYRGDLFMVDATVTTWDEARGDYAPRGALDEEQALLDGRQAPRPYLLGLRGSRTYAANTLLKGLGYHGRSSSFGVALASRLDPSAQRGDNTLRGYVSRLPAPTGVFIGNTISHAFFGFFTDNAGPVLLLGNVFRDSVVYNVAPNDDTEDMIIARNVAVGAAMKHGIILSREVRGALIEGNVSFLNQGNGIMLDRDSGNATMRDNIAFANAGDGIAVFQSNASRLANNLLFANDNNGIHVRNSVNVDIEANTVDRNGHYGIEVATAELSGDPARDPALNPYSKTATTRILANTLRRNLSGAIASKDADELFLRGNDFSGSGPRIFAGDLGTVAAEALEGNAGRGFHFSPTPPRATP